MEWIKKHPLTKKMIIMVIVIIVAWLLGQLAGPVIVKAIFL